LRLSESLRLRWGDGTPLRDGRDAVGKLVSAIGKEAGVVVDERLKANRIVRSQCSRPATGVRPAMAGRVMPNVIRELMRHADIGTTMKFYVGQNAEQTAETLWASVVDTSVDTHEAGKTADAKKHCK
jgi:hypothetical protein